MDEPNPSDYPLNEQGTADFMADMEVWRNTQRNNLRREQRARAAELLAQNDALPADSGVPGSRDAAIATTGTDNLYAGVGVGARVFAPVQGLMGTLAESLQQSVPRFLPTSVRRPLVQFFDTSAEGARLSRDQARQTSEGIDRYLEARRLLRDEGGFDTPSAILAGGEVARQLAGGPVAQALMAYGERDDIGDAAADLAASKVARALPFKDTLYRGSTVPVATAETKRRAADLLAEKMFGELRGDS